MPWFVLAALAAVLAILIFHRRLPFPYGDLITAALCIVAIPWGVVAGAQFWQRAIETGPTR